MLSAVAAAPAGKMRDTCRARGGMGLLVGVEGLLVGVGLGTLKAGANPLLGEAGDPVVGDPLVGVDVGLGDETEVGDPELETGDGLRVGEVMGVGEPAVGDGDDPGDVDGVGEEVGVGEVGDPGVTGVGDAVPGDGLEVGDVTAVGDDCAVGEVVVGLVGVCVGEGDDVTGLPPDDGDAVGVGEVDAGLLPGDAPGDGDPEGLLGGGGGVGAVTCKQSQRSLLAAQTLKRPHAGGKIEPPADVAGY